MNIVITEQWAKATGKGLSVEDRTFEVVKQEDNIKGRRGFDSFFTVDNNGYDWVVAASRVESVIH
jgi:hypothetical protein